MEPLVDAIYKLEKFEGKGGWVYARIPEVAQAGDTPFGWVKVSGTIDGYTIHKMHLMPMGDGKLMLPVRAEIRKAIDKQAGAKVHIVLYPDNEPLEIPGELHLCLEDEPAALRFFRSLSESQQRYYINWIYAAKKLETKTSRMATAIEKLSCRVKFYEK